jgi:hypothetical protein
MNRVTPNILNRIKQPSQCCVQCGKSYQNKSNLEKHVILCELLNAKNVPEDDEHIPSQQKIYKILLELGKKFNKLEEKVDELNKWVVKKKQKINAIEWLNKNITPEITFDCLIEKINIVDEDVTHLFENSFADTLNHIFSRNIYNVTEEKYPIIAFVQKTNIFYAYENKEIGWIELNKEIFIKFLNKVHMKLYRIYTAHKKDNAHKIQEDESFSLLCDKTTVKMMHIDFRQDNIFGKIKTNMYSRMKTDMMTFVEYEFEF